jgi:hypothetical protein
MAAQAKSIGKAKSAKGIGTSAGYKKSRTTDAPPKLAEAGIDKSLAHRAKLVGSTPEKAFEKAMADAHANEEPPEARPHRHRRPSA